MKMQYHRWISSRITRRRVAYRPTIEPGLLSLVTPVYNTPPRFLRVLADSVFHQDFPQFEWVIIDNGSTHEATRAELAKICRDDRVVFQQLETNAGIMSGTRAAVEQASGRYVLPVDSDDRLYPDALRVMASSLQQHRYPAIAYSDEDKLTEHDEPCHPFLKPDWDPVLFFNICYVAHLCAIDRATALELDAYTDENARGCHDWDTFWRFVRAGHTPLHVREVLYSWRMHAGSTSTPGLAPKDYTLDCQEHVLQSHLHEIGNAERLEMRVNPLFGDTGLWQVTRCRDVSDRLNVVVLATEDNWRSALTNLAESDYPAWKIHVIGSHCSADDEEEWNAMPGANDMPVHFLEGNDLAAPSVAAFLDMIDQNEPVAIVRDELIRLSLDWPWEACGLLELFPDAVMVGGRTYDHKGQIVSAGEVFGMDGFSGCPNRHVVNDEKGWYGLHICQRTVDAVSGDFFIGRAGFLRRALAEMPAFVGRSLLGTYLGTMAKAWGQPVIYTPHIVAQYRSGAEPLPPSREEQAAFCARFGKPRNDGRMYSSFLSPDSKDGFGLANANGQPAEVAVRYEIIQTRLVQPGVDSVDQHRLISPATEQCSKSSPVRP